MPSPNLPVLEADVREIITTSQTSLVPFIAAADSIIQDEFLSSNSSHGTLTPARLFEIERWLAAHFVAMLEPQYRIERVEHGLREGVQLAGKFGDNLSLTVFGQTAMVLDSTGTLSQLGKATARLTVVKPGTLPGNLTGGPVVIL